MKKLLTILLLIYSITLGATTYYVSSSDGNDSDSGLTPALAKATLSWVNGVTFAAGDSILFKRGDTFRGSIYQDEDGTSSDWIYYGAYGTGSKPKLLGSKDLSATGDWTNHSGNVWKTTATLGTNQNDISNIVLNNEASVGKKRNSLVGCDAQGEFFYNTTDDLLYLYSTSNPGTFYTHIEACGNYDVNQGLLKWNASSYIIVQNLDIRYSSAAGIEFGESSNFIIEYCDLSWIGGEWYDSGTGVRLGNGISMINNVSDGIVRYNIINQCYDAGISPQGWTAGYIQEDIQQYYNIITNCYYSYEGYGAATGCSMIDVNFYNNTCVDAGSCWSNTSDQRPDYVNSRHVMIWKEDGTHTNCNIKNNIFSGTCITAIRIDEDEIYAIKHIFNNNLYYVTTIASTSHGTLTTLLQWQTTESQDANGVSGNPLFVSSTDLHLQAASPAINVGVDLGLIVDYSGFSKYGTNWDIGAYEYQSYPNRWWISIKGSDTNGDGSWDAPWLTLKHATDTVTGVNFVGDTIIVGVGTFPETAQIVKGLGVSIYGAGATSIITTAAALNPIILCSSVSEGTSDNSSISYIKIDGNSLVALSGISVYARSNISIHHCTFVNIMHWAILMCGRIDHTNGAPTTYATGNSIYNNTITNCSSYDTWGRGAISFAGQDGILIYDNPISQTGRTPAPNQMDGYLIKAYPCEGHNKAFKIYGNTLTTHSNCNIWRFAIELFNTHGGAEVYNNTIQGTVDIGSPSSGVGTDDLGSYGFALKIYDNLMVNDAPQTSLGSKIFGVDVEGDISGGVYIYRNKMVNCASGVHFSQTTGKVVDGVYIYYNVMNGIGISGYANYGSGVRVGSNNNAVFSNIEILNNTINANELTTSPQYGIYLNTGTGLCSNFIIRNNICHGFNDITDTSRGIRIQTCIIDSINVDNNNLYDCRNSNDIEVLTSTLTNSTQAGNIKVDPLFLTANGDFHLQSGSLCIDEGLDVGLTTDYSGHSKYGIAFDIGAYEWGKWWIMNGINLVLNNGNTVYIIQ